MLPVEAPKHAMSVWDVMLPERGNAEGCIVTVKLQVPVFPAASVAVYVTVVIPSLNVNTPTWFIPDTGDDAVVAPVITHVRSVTEQLSFADASGTVTDAVV